jgi:hypothetical protein
LTVPDDDAGWQVNLTADRAEQLGCLVWEMNLRRSQPTASDAQALRAWADRVARRVTGLLETLKVVEVDAAQHTAMLRSEAPAAKGDELHYYEVLLRGTVEATVRRYRGSRQPSTPRTQIGFALTHEAIVKLADDLTAEK